MVKAEERAKLERLEAEKEEMARRLREAEAAAREKKSAWRRWKRNCKSAGLSGNAGFKKKDRPQGGPEDGPEGSLRSLLPRA